MPDDDLTLAARRRALSYGLEPLTWPPRVGARVHKNAGWGAASGTSWSGEVRAVVDDEIAVVLRYSNRRGWVWFTLDRLEVECHARENRDGERGMYWYGPLPAEVMHERVLGERGERMGHADR